MADGRLRPARLSPPRWNCTRSAKGRRPDSKVTGVSAACKSEHMEGLNDFIVMAKRATYAAAAAKSLPYRLGTSDLRLMELPRQLRGRGRLPRPGTRVSRSAASLEHGVLRLPSRPRTYRRRAGRSHRAVGADPSSMRRVGFLAALLPTLASTSISIPTPEMSVGSPAKSGLSTKDGGVYELRDFGGLIRY